MHDRAMTPEAGTKVAGMVPTEKSKLSEGGSLEPSLQQFRPMWINIIAPYRSTHSGGYGNDGDS